MSRQSLLYYSLPYYTFLSWSVERVRELAHNLVARITSFCPTSTTNHDCNPKSIRGV